MLDNNGSHLRSLGLAYFIAGVAELAIILIAAAVLLLITTVWSLDPGHQSEPMALLEVALLFPIAICYPLPSMAAGYNFWRGGQDSYMLAWIATALHAVNFPIGTLIAGYGVIVLRRARPEEPEA